MIHMLSEHSEPQSQAHIPRVWEICVWIPGRRDLLRHCSGKYERNRLHVVTNHTRPGIDEAA